MPRGNFSFFCAIDDDDLMIQQAFDNVALLNDVMFEN